MTNLGMKWLGIFVVTGTIAFALVVFGTRLPPDEIDVLAGLESLCFNHHGSACAAAAVLHESGGHGEAWYDRTGWPRRKLVVLRNSRNADRAALLREYATKEGWSEMQTVIGGLWPNVSLRPTGQALC